MLGSGGLSRNGRLSRNDRWSTAGRLPVTDHLSRNGCLSRIACLPKNARLSVDACFVEEWLSVGEWSLVRECLFAAEWPCTARSCPTRAVHTPRARAKHAPCMRPTHALRAPSTRTERALLQLVKNAQHAGGEPAKRPTAGVFNANVATRSDMGACGASGRACQCQHGDENDPKDNAICRRVIERAFQHPCLDCRAPGACTHSRMFGRTRANGPNSHRAPHIS